MHKVVTVFLVVGLVLSLTVCVLCFYSCSLTHSTSADTHYKAVTFLFNSQFYKPVVSFKHCMVL